MLVDLEYPFYFYVCPNLVYAEKTYTSNKNFGRYGHLKKFTDIPV